DQHDEHPRCVARMGKVLAAVRPSEQRPGERGDPRGRSSGEQQARTPLEPDLPGGERGHDASAADTSATVSHSAGARILATWGANTGEWQTTSRAGPSETISPSA